MHYYPLKVGHREITAEIQEMVTEVMMSKGCSHRFNSPVWLVLKQNRQYRLTIDYRNINKMSSKMPGSLPDPEEVIHKITQRKSKFYVTIDMSDMFFAIPISEDSKEYTTFTWEGAQYQFNRLPQGYLNNPDIAHSILASHN